MDADQRAAHVLRQADREIAQAERWLKVSSVCRRLDVHFRTVYRWIDEQKIAPESVRQTAGGQYRIRESALIRILERDATP
jgi:excisionase family DNA binding protein